MSRNLTLGSSNRSRLLSSLSALLLTACTLAGGAMAADPPENPPRFDPRLQKFFAAKERHARALAAELKLEVAPEIWDYFDAGIEGDWATVRKLWRTLSNRSGQYSRGVMDEKVRTVVWSPLLEAELGYECFDAMDIKFVEAFARGTIDSIPRGSIYFGGTDPGRGVITAFCKSHADADPFFVLTQNALADGTYLKYLRATYGKRISVPSEEDSKKAFDEYLADAEKRMQQGKLKPGEQVSKKDGKLQVSGQIAVMAINGLIAKQIFERNPKYEFYIEESFPLDWMYPHLAPHGLIMKLNRKPLSKITETMLRKDRDYWRKQMATFLGDWLTEETPLKVICEFVERVYLDGDLSQFKGDPLYVTADRSYSPRKLFGKLREAHAGLYLWRMEHASTGKEKETMRRAAEFTFKQAMVLCPESPEYARRLVELLRAQKRTEDADLVLKTGLRMNPSSRRLGKLADEFEVNSQ